MRSRPVALVGAAVVWAVVSCSSEPSRSGDAENLAEADIDASIDVTSSAFADGEAIPVKFTCDGDDVSPPLAWENVPAAAEELVLVVDDPDAPGGTYLHWILSGLDPSSSGIDEATVPNGATAAENSAGDAAYKGPCPPGGDDAHTYRFTLYALDELVTSADGDAGADFLALVADAAIAKGTLTGTFDR